MTSPSNSKRMQLDDILECSICTDLFKDPRSLPCVHTFCLKCINEYCEKKQVGDKMGCPLCRKEFDIPEGGVTCLPKNFFIDKLINWNQLTEAKSEKSLCEVCSLAKKTQRGNLEATMICVDCLEKLCAGCAEIHTIQKVTKSHKLIPLGERLADNDLASLAAVNATMCDKHPEEELKLYCVQCKVALCVICCIELHNGHKYSNLTDVAEKFRMAMQADAEEMAAGIAKCKELLEARDDYELNFSKLAAELEKEIHNRAEQLKQKIDKDIEDLLSELVAIKQNRTKQMDLLREEIEQQMISLEAMKKYMEELTRKGTATDIVRESATLHSRVEELVKFDGVQEMLDELGVSEVRFSPDTSSTDDTDKNLIGVLTEHSKHQRQPLLLHTIHSSSQVTGIAVDGEGNRLFVAWVNKNAVDVYDTVTFQLQRTVPLAVVNYIWGLAACANNNCLYAGDLGAKKVHKIDLSGYNTTASWNVNDSTFGLSVNRARNILVAYYLSVLLDEYTTDGTHVRQIKLQSTPGSSIANAVELNVDGRLIVSYGVWTSTYYVSEILPDGSIKRRYCDENSIAAKQLQGFGHLAVDKKDNIFVPEWSSPGRILVLDSSLNWSRDLELPAVDNGLQQPYILCLDETRNRLYVGESTRTSRILVFDNIRC